MLHHHPSPRKPSITELNDYWPVALTSVVMKFFERPVLSHLKDITGLQDLDSPGTYARILFVDFSSAFNTIIPELLHQKLTQFSVPATTCQWIISFLIDRQQHVRLGSISSKTRSISTGAPQGCVLSPLLFSLYTNDCT